MQWREVALVDTSLPLHSLYLVRDGTADNE
jgi:hypothetical protein